MNSLQELWSSGDTQSINKPPCTLCGADEGYAHMLLCDTCNRAFHLQCLHPPCSVVPDGDWHCHLCDEAFSHVDELHRTDTICHDSGSSVNTITVWGVTSPDITRVDNDITPIMTAGAQ